MVTEATKKFRDIFSYGLLVVAALYLLSGLSLLFKSEDEVGPFTERAALFGHVFASPVLVLSLLGAVALAVGFGSQSLNARLIVTAALAIAAAALLFALISWFSGFGVDSGGFGLEAFGGVLGAGKIVSILLGLAQLLALGLTAFFAFTTFQSLPKSSAKTAGNPWGQSAGQPGQAYLSGQGYEPNSGWHGQGYEHGVGQPAQGHWQPQPGYGDTPPGYPSHAQSWEQNPGQPSYPQPVQQQGVSQPVQSTWGQGGEPGGGQAAWSQGQQAGGQIWGPPAQAAPEHRPEDTTEAPAPYPADVPHTGAPPTGAHGATVAERGEGDSPHGNPPPPPQTR